MRKFFSSILTVDLTSHIAETSAHQEESLIFIYGSILSDFYDVSRFNI